MMRCQQACLCGAIGFVMCVIVTPFVEAGWTITPRGSMLLIAGPVTNIRELSGVTYLGPVAGVLERFAAIQDENNRFVVFDVAFAADGSINSATAVNAKTLAVAADMEGIAYTSAARDSVFISDETGAGVREFSMATGQVLQTVPIPTVFQSDRSNRGLESLTRSLDGRTMWTGNEEALTIDGPASSQAAGTMVRLLRMADDGTNVTAGAQYAYLVDPIQAGSGPDRSGLSDLTLLPDDSLLALERSRVTSLPMVQSRIYQVDFSTATDVSAAAFNSGLIGKTYTPVTKTPLWSGIVGAGENMEGLGLGPVLANGHWILLGVTDDAGLGLNRIASFELSLGGCGTAGDFNCDGNVDEADYRLWKNTFGSTKALAADGNGDGEIDAADYTIWRDHTSAAAGEAAEAEGKALPEPTAWVSAVGGLLALLARREFCRRGSPRLGT